MCLTYKLIDSFLEFALLFKSGSNYLQDVASFPGQSHL